MSLFINDIRFHGTFPGSVFLKIWGGISEEISIHSQMVKNAPNPNPDLLNKNELKIPDKNSFHNNVLSRNKTITEDIV